MPYRGNSLFRSDQYSLSQLRYCLLREKNVRMPRKTLYARGIGFGFIMNKSISMKMVPIPFGLLGRQDP